MTRKDFITSSLITTAGMSLGMNAATAGKAGQQSLAGDSLLNGMANEKMKVCVFSKQLQWLGYKEMAENVAQMGFDGIDLTVRNNGHVLPERVEEDLPKAVEAAEKAGIKIHMISTDIREAREPFTERILKTASALGIKHYRTSGLNYQASLDVPANLELIKSKFSGIAAINKKYGLQSDYLNHSGEGFGSSIWDLWLTIKDLDPQLVGSQFDINHSTIAGPFSWATDLKLIHPYVHTTVIRDFEWQKKDNSWQAVPVPVGTGMVDLKKYFGLVKKYNIKGPICLMCDYDLAGAEHGSKTLTGSSGIVFNAMKKDLQSIRRLLQENDL